MRPSVSGRYCLKIIPNSYEYPVTMGFKTAVSGTENQLRHQHSAIVRLAVTWEVGKIRRLLYLLFFLLLIGIHKLQSDYRRMLQKGTVSDACIVVRGKEFKVHRFVLCARSTVFEAMFNHDTAEKESGRVVIDDLDPDTFGDFLEYLYTGDAQNKLSGGNAFGLYVAADKYDVATLKSDCIEHMQRTLSVDSFSDVVTLALRHREEDLLQHAISFFKDNLHLIFISERWQQLVIDNCASVNEFLSKAYSLGTQ